MTVKQKDHEQNRYISGRPVRPMRLADDGPEALSIAIHATCDYKKEVLPVPANRKLTVKMAPGGGYAARISKR